MCMRMPVGEDEVIQKNMALAQKKDYTVLDLEMMPEDVRAEVIDGQLYYFATPLVIHQQLIVELGFSLKDHIKKEKGKCRMLVAPVAVYLGEDQRTTVEPDIIVVCNPDQLTEKGCCGGPDLVIEVTSKSTKDRDYGIKMLKYRMAGVREYWIVDPMKRTVMVYWFEDESQNCLYSFEDEVCFHLFPGLAVTVSSLLAEGA